MAEITREKPNQTQVTKPTSAPSALVNGKKPPLLDVADNSKFQQLRELLKPSILEWPSQKALISLMEESPEVIPYILSSSYTDSIVHVDAITVMTLAARNEKTRDAAFAVLCTALHNENPSIRWSAGCIFIRLAEHTYSYASTDISKAMPDIVQTLTDPNESVRWTMASTLWHAAQNKQSIAPAIPGLAKMLSDRYNEAAKYAVYALTSAGKNGEDLSPALSALERMFYRNPSTSSVMAAGADEIASAICAATINENSHDAALAILLRCLATKEEKLKSLAISSLRCALSSKSRDSAFEMLIALLKDSDPNMRRAAAWTLGTAAEYDHADISPAIPALALASNGCGCEVHDAVSYALSKAAVNGTDISFAVPALSDIFCTRDPKTGHHVFAGRAGWALENAAEKSGDPLIILKGLIEPLRTCPGDGHVLAGLLGIAKRMQGMDNMSKERLMPVIADVLDAAVTSPNIQQGTDALYAISNLIQVLAYLPDNMQTKFRCAVYALIQKVIECVAAQPDAAIFRTADPLIAFLACLPNGLLSARTMRTITVKVRNILYSQEFLRGANKNSPEYAKTCISCAEIMDRLKKADAKLEASA